MELEIDGRKFVIDSVNFGTDEVSPVSYTHLDVYKRQDAKRAASALNRRLLQRDIPGMGKTAVTGYDFGQWASAAKRLLEHGHSFVFAQPNETDGYDVINEDDRCV